MAEEKRGFTVKEACIYLGISRTTLYRLVDQGSITHVNIGGRIVFDRKDLDDLIEKSKAKPEQSTRGRRKKPPKLD
jgi:excisionase family DNA binding protein